jgi:glucose/arabinose dehydrogenase
MKPTRKALTVGLSAFVIATGGCAVVLATGGETAKLQEQASTGPRPMLPEPNQTLIPTVLIATAKGWSNDAKPRPASGLSVNRYAANLDHPRWLYVLPNGDVLVSETNAPKRSEEGRGLKGWIYQTVQGWAGAGVPSANRITLLRDADGDGSAETRTVLLAGLNSPFGMTLVEQDLYVANTDAVMRFPYVEGETQITAQGVKVADLPAGPLNHHWTKNLIASKNGSRLYATVGSNSNVGENGLDKEERRAAILEIDPATGRSRVFASGLRNPNGLAWQPQTNALWTTVNERDELGSDLVPDYLTSVTDELTFSTGTLLPETLRNGAFIGQHGSWNRKPRAGYKVIFVPFADGRPSGQPIDVLTGFVSEAGDALGRPVGVAIDRLGALLVADDVGNSIWRVTPAAQNTAMAR